MLDANELIKLKAATRSSWNSSSRHARARWASSLARSFFRFGRPRALASRRQAALSSVHAWFTPAPVDVARRGRGSTAVRHRCFRQRDDGQETRFTWVHPSDGSVGFESNEAANAVTLRHPLNLPLLEKGVIRSARVRWLAVSSSLSDGQLTRLADLCFDAELPIST
ncbi:MAG: hypothetical protein R3B96_21525 [Pirellulaceae bacterium]